MPLSDPELDLLRELLEDDPQDSVFLQVGAELVRRANWKDAEVVLGNGLAGNDEPEAWGLLARAALETGNYQRSLEAWNRSGPELQQSTELQRVRILALERSGAVDKARVAVDAYESLNGSDVVIESVRERIEAPPPKLKLSAADPFLTVEHAERYAKIGRPDRAVRIYRRILFRHPTDLAIRSRLLQLSTAGHDLGEPDLSEELTAPDEMPPDLQMPGPAITSASVEPAPQRVSGPRRSLKPSGLAAFMGPSSIPPGNTVSATDSEPEPTSSDSQPPAPKRRKRRRSLLKR